MNIDPRRRLTDSEIGEASELLSSLENFILTDVEDRRIWRGAGADFSVKSAGKILSIKRREAEQLGLPNFPYTRVWLNTSIPPKVCFFVWTLLRGRVLTVDKLQKRGMLVVNRCCLCKICDESRTHLFSSCILSKKIWAYFWESFGLVFYCDMGFEDLLSTPPPHSASRIGKFYWELLFHAIVWSIWLERNSRCFQGIEKRETQIISSVKELIWSWGLSNPIGKTLFLDDVICSWPRLINL